MIRSKTRIARRPYRCDCGAAVPKGGLYMEHVASPHHDDLGNTKWWRIVECLGCARRYRRWPE